MNLLYRSYDQMINKMEFLNRGALRAFPDDEREDMVGQYY